MRSPFESHFVLFESVQEFVSANRNRADCEILFNRTLQKVGSHLVHYCTEPVMER
jgi:hypothetical protein